jgi:hypothetical protein
MLVIESYNGRPKRLVKTNYYFRVVKTFRSYSQPVNNRSRLASLLKREWFYCKCGSQRIISLWTLQFGGWHFCFISTMPERPTALVQICWAPPVIQVQLSEEARPLSISQSVQTGCGDHPVARRYMRRGGGAVFPDVKLPIHFCLGPRLRMSGAIPSLPHMSSGHVHGHLNRNECKHGDGVLQRSDTNSIGMCIIEVNFTREHATKAQKGE